MNPLLRAALARGRHRTRLASVRWPAGRYGMFLRLLALWLQGELLLVEVRGRSMEPTLSHGDRLLCSRRGGFRTHAIVVRDTDWSGSAQRYQIKRLEGLAGDERGGGVIRPGWCWIEGDNKDESGDSRTFGPIRQTELIAVAVGVLRAGHLYGFIERDAASSTERASHRCGDKSCYGGPMRSSKAHSTGASRSHAGWG